MAEAEAASPRGVERAVVNLSPFRPIDGIPRSGDSAPTPLTQPATQRDSNGTSATELVTPSASSDEEEAIPAPPRLPARLAESPMRDVEASVESRIAWAAEVRERLRGVPRRSCQNDGPRKAVLRVIGSLGRGSYGTVYEACLTAPRTPVCSPSWNRVAIKHQRLVPYSANYVERAFAAHQEVAAMRLANALVRARVCPNLPLLYEPFYCEADEQGTVGAVDIVMEYSDGSFRQLMAERGYNFWPRGGVPADVRRQVMAATCQVFMAVCAVALNMGMSHNDLYTRNVLYNLVDTPHIDYVLGGRRVRCPTHGMLVKVADFGLASVSSPGDFGGWVAGHADQLREPVSAMGFREARRPLSRGAPELRHVHVLETETPAFTRDVVSWLSSMPRFPWVEHALDSAFEEPPTTPGELVGFVQHVLGPLFLAETGEDPRMFDAPAAASAAEGEEVFRIRRVPESLMASALGDV